MILLAGALLMCVAAAADYRQLEWLELMPEDEAKAWLEGSTEVDHSGFGAPEPFQSYRTVGELDGQDVRIPGFVVPIETDGEGNLKEFFLVPYFGACIHVPPPPANQIIYGRLADPIPMVNIWDAFWMEGKLNIENIENETAASAYTMDVTTLELY
ncbi:MAG: DUF3299 domain-containing protein [Wenzhouxiangella sp.]|jgi:hypothetical protein|nr:DUF3299 domain-containing protein [Wenzhouxiangella sp.]